MAARPGALPPSQFRLSRELWGLGKGGGRKSHSQCLLLPVEYGQREQQQHCGREDARHRAYDDDCVPLEEAQELQAGHRPVPSVCMGRHCGEPADARRPQGRPSSSKRLGEGTGLSGNSPGSSVVVEGRPSGSTTRLWGVGGERRAQLREGQPLEGAHAFKDSRVRCSVGSFSQACNTAFPCPQAPLQRQGILAEWLPRERARVWGICDIRQV